MEANDILLDDENDFKLLNGDFFVGGSDEQHIQHLLQSVKGNFLQFPTVGVQITDFINGNLSKVELEKRVRLELTKDGYFLKTLTIDLETGQISIDAKRRN